MLDGFTRLCLFRLSSDTARLFSFARTVLGRRITLVEALEVVVDAVRGAGLVASPGQLVSCRPSRTVRPLYGPLSLLL